MSVTAASQSPAKRVRPTRMSTIRDGRTASAKLFKRAVAQLTELAGGQPNDLQRRWISMAAGLQVEMHLMTRHACSIDIVPPEHARAYAAISKQLVSLTDRIVRGAPDRRHERQEPSERPDLSALLVEDDDG